MLQIIVSGKSGIRSQFLYFYKFKSRKRRNLDVAIYLVSFLKKASCLLIKKAVTSCFEMTANLIGKLKVSIATKCIDQIPIFNAIAVKRALCAIAPCVAPYAYGAARLTGASRMRVRVQSTQRALCAIAFIRGFAPERKPGGTGGLSGRKAPSPRQLSSFSCVAAHQFCFIQHMTLYRLYHLFFACSWW